MAIRTADSGPLTIRFNCLPVLAGILLLASCTGSQQAAQPASAGMPQPAAVSIPAQPDTASLPNLATLEQAGPTGAGLPLQDIPRNGSALQSKQLFPGRQYVRVSSHTLIEPMGELTMLSGPGEIDYAIYEAFNCNARTTHVDLNLTIIDGECWIAQANYQTGRWELAGPYTAGNLPPKLVIDSAKYYSPLHRQYFAVLVMDGSKARLDDYTVTIEVPDLTPVLVAGNAAGALDLIDLAGRPGIAYMRDEGGDQVLTFKMADISAPQDAGDWQTSTIDSVNLPLHLSATVHNGRAVVLYSGADGVLRLARAKVAFPQQDSDWELQELVSDRLCESCSVFSDDERLYFACFENDLGDLEGDNSFGYLYYGHSLSSDAFGSYSSYRVRSLGSPTGAADAQPALTMIDGSPAIAIPDYSPLTGSPMLYCFADSKLPDLPEWHSHYINNGALLTGTSLQEIDGKPVIFWTGNNPYIYACKVARPETEFDWDFHIVFIDTIPGYLDMLVLNDRPILAYGYSGQNPHTISVQMCAPRYNLMADRLEPLGCRILPGALTSFGDAQVSLASIGNQAALAWSDPLSQSLNFVQLND